MVSFALGMIPNGEGNSGLFSAALLVRVSFSGYRFLGQRPGAATLCARSVSMMGAMTSVPTSASNR